jgi:hypothetical protein
MSLAASLVVLLLMVSLLWLWGSAQSPRMNPCPSARPGEGEQEQNRRGSLSARSGSERSDAKIGGDRFCSCLGVPGQSPRTPDPTKERRRSATQYFGARDGSRQACAAVALSRSVRENEAYWQSFCPPDLPVPVMNRLRLRKGNGTRACRVITSNRVPQSGGQVLGKVRMVKVGLFELQSPAVNR